MKSVELKAEVRDDVRNKTALKNLRKQGNIPAVLYGGKENKNFFVDEVTFSKLINTHEVYIINLKIGEEVIPAIIKDIQFHPVTDATIHIDFLQVFEDKLVNIGIPLTFTGSSIGVLNGGKRREKMRKLTVRALPKDLPENIEIDITNLKIGDDVKVRDLNVKGVEFLNAPSTSIVAVKTSRAAISAEAEEEAEGAEAGDATEEAAAE